MSEQLVMTPTGRVKSGDSQDKRRNFASSGTPASHRLQLPATIGCIVGLDEAGRPLVDFQHNPEPVPLAAKTVVDIPPAAIGSEVLIIFQDSDLLCPVVTGIVRDSALRASSTIDASTVQVTSDGEKVFVQANREIVLKCGEASITLTRAGKVIISGKYVVTKSSGVNRIKGGSVQIN